MKRYLFLCVLLAATAANAGRYAGEICEDAHFDSKTGWTYRPVPCKEDPDEVKRGKVCGKDHGALRVGMTIKRFEQCNEALTLEGETVTAAGVTQIYASTFHMIRARDGKIISYSSR